VLEDVLSKTWPLCSQTDPEIFFPDPDQPSEREKALAMCEACHVRVECLAECFITGSIYGIWGGILPSYRRDHHSEFNRTRPDPLEFAAQVIASVTEVYRTTTDRAQDRIDRGVRSTYRDRERERKLRSSRKARLMERLDEAS
jgi:hypothetical protein